MERQRYVSKSSTETEAVSAGPRRSPSSIATKLVWVVSGALSFLLLFRFAMKAGGANEGAWFARFVYDLSDVFVAPFASVFAAQEVADGVFEWSTLLAAFVYALLAWGVVSVIRAISPGGEEVAAFRRVEVAAGDEGAAPPKSRETQAPAGAEGDRRRPDECIGPACPA